MRILKKKEEVSGNRALINSFLNTGQIEMELATSSQLEEIQEKLNSNQFGFEYLDNGTALRILRGD